MATGRQSTEVTSGAPDVTRLQMPRFRVSEAFFRPGHVMASHYHDRAVLSVVLEGRFVQRFPGKECPCPPGGYIVKPPGERHIDRWDAEVARHLIVEPDPARHEELMGDGFFEETRHDVDPGAEALARRIMHELAGDEPGRDLAVEALVLELMVRIRRGPVHLRWGDEPPGWLVRVRDLIRDRFRENLSLDELAAEAGVHRCHLSRTFGAYYSSGIADYIRALKIDAAKRELRETDHSISRIAAGNGFADQSHLTRTLKAATGLTPGRFRALHRGG